MRLYKLGAHTKTALKVHLIWIPKYRKRVLSCPAKSESLGFQIIGMKFDVVIQWVIAYGRLVVYPFAGLAVALGKMVLTSYNSLQSLLWHCEIRRKLLRKSHLTKV